MSGADAEEDKLVKAQATEPPRKAGGSNVGDEVRYDHDALGSIAIPGEALYGSNAARAATNFAISGRLLGSSPYFVKAFAWLKAAAALANAELGTLDPSISDAVVKAAREMGDGALNAHLIVDMFEGSGGTSLNMNVNEVLANRGLQLMGLRPGAYEHLHPNDHVNCGQSTNDVVPSAIKLGCWFMLNELVTELDQLAAVFHRKAIEAARMLRLGRTCFQDAQPMTLGQAFGADASLVERLASQLRDRKEELRHLPMGATAIGTGFGAVPGYREKVFEAMACLTGENFLPAANLFDALANGDVYSRLSGELRNTGVGLAKIANDFILLSSGPTGGVAELVLPTLQPGSSIMPGKVNPVLPMAVCQLGFTLTGYDVIVASAVQQGQFEINPYEPVVAFHLFESLKLLINGVRLFRELCVEGIEPQVERMRQNLMESSAIATAFLPIIGYDKTSKLVRRSLQEGKPFITLVEAEGLMGGDEAVALIYRAVGLAPDGDLPA